MLGVAGHGALLRQGESIADAVILTRTCGVRKEAYFTREYGDAEGHLG